MCNLTGQRPMSQPARLTRQRALLAAFGLLLGLLPGMAAAVPSYTEVKAQYRASDAWLLARDGQVLQQIRLDHQVRRLQWTPLEAMSPALLQALLYSEDQRFYQHAGIDWLAVASASWRNLWDSRTRGASTITMQVARNFFLSSEKTASRKLSEALLAIKIEHNLTKDQILELYINQIYLGQRSYGFAAASQVYYGKPLNKLSVAEAAMLAGLPKAPSRYNPFANPKRATARQHYVLRRMNELRYIDENTYQKALNEPQKFRQSKQVRDLAADYVAEIARQMMYQRYKDDIYTSGLKVYTTIRKSNQEAANKAVLQGILDYDSRHGYRGPEKVIQPPAHGTEEEANWIDKALDEIEVSNGLIPAMIINLSPKLVTVHSQSGEDIQITGNGLSLVQKTLNEKDASKRKLMPGAIVRIVKTTDGWQITQLPQVQSGFIALDPATGAVTALVGGFDFNRNKFNHVTQAWRQPGSSFKPFIYSASLEKGFTPASMIDDEPITLSAAETGSGSAWEPKNFDNTYEGPMRMRTALTKSKNMVSIRILQSIGVRYAQDYITRFGFSPKDHPPYLAMALGSGSVTPWQMAGAYAVFANGGYRVRPYIISKIVDPRGKVIEETKFDEVGKNAVRVIDARNAFLMTSMMQDVARIGTAAKARQIGRYDLAGKTGTTNSQIDAWFAGFNPKQVAITWIGYDQPRSLGSNETGGRAALPIWIDYMTNALRNVPDEPYSVPPGITSVKINPHTGMRVSDDESGIYEYFYQEFMPPDGEDNTFSPIPGFTTSKPPESTATDPTRADQLF